MMRKLYFLLLISLLIIPYGAAIQFTQTPGDSANNSPLLFLGNSNIAPVVFLEGTTPKGVVVDIVRALALHISQPIEIKAMNWSEAQTLVARGEADALIQINPTEERLKIYDFSDNLLESKFSIFTGSNTLGLSGVESLRGRKIGVESGGLPQKVLITDPQIHLFIIPNFSDGFYRIQEGSLDAVVVDYRVGSYVLAKNNIQNIKVTGEPVAFSNSSIAVKKGNTKLLNEINAALKIIKEDGTYQTILDSWKPKEGRFQTWEQVTEQTYLVGILISCIIILFSIIWIMSMKKDLSRRKEAEDKLRLVLEHLEEEVSERTTQLTEANNSLVQEIAERKRAEEALRQINHKLTLLSSITRHDIGNEVQIIFGYLDLAQEDDLDPTILEYIRNAYQSSLNIERQLSFTRDYEDIGVHSPIWQDINDVINRTVQNIELSQIQMRVEISGVEVFADPLLEKVFFNLIDNAKRYGETISRIRFFGCETGSEFHIICEDDGVGIPEEFKGKIFNREYYKHTGFGLNLSREILDITGITIRETGEPGDGARFVIQVPKGMFRTYSDEKKLRI